MPSASSTGDDSQLSGQQFAAEVVDDPDPWEPTDDELSAITAELEAVVTEMRATREFHGVGDEAVCRHCAYRGVCDESAAPAPPSWPEPGTAA